VYSLYPENGRACLHRIQQWLSPAACLDLRAPHAVRPASDPPAAPWRLLEVRHSTQQRSARCIGQCRYVVRACTTFQVRQSCCRRGLKPLCAGSEVFKGMYGDWRIEESDVREVWGYRAGLSVAAAGARLASFVEQCFSCALAL